MTHECDAMGEKERKTELDDISKYTYGLLLDARNERENLIFKCVFPLLMKTRDLLSYPFHRVFRKNHTRVVPSDDELLDPSSIYTVGGVRAAAALIQLVCHVLSPSLGVREYCFAYLFSCFSSEHFLKCRALLCAPDSWRGSCEIIFHKIYECCSRREPEGGEREDGS